MYRFADLAAIEKALQPFWPSRLNRHGQTTEYMTSFMDYLGNPQNQVRTVHIAGTSGKTSTAYYVAALLQQTGKKTGLLVSPHVEKLNERVQINGLPLPKKQFCSEFALFFEVVHKSGIQLTITEILYGFAFWEFARLQVDYNVIETGLGGLLDATNVLARTDTVCIITDIGLDHTTVLGATLGEISEHKAGIIGLHNAVFCYRQPQVVMRVIMQASKQKQADLHIVTKPTTVAVDVLPLFQKRNLGLAIEATNFVLESDMRPVLDQNQIAAAAEVHIPARMERVVYQGKTIIFDVAHNPQKLQALRESIEAQYPAQKVAVLAAFVEGRGRQLDRQLVELQPIAASLIVPTMPDGPIIWYDRKEVAKAATAVGIPDVQDSQDYITAFKELLRQPQPILLVTGSLYLQQYIRPLICR